MLSPSDFNNAVPQFTNGDYASNPINPQYIAEPDAENYNRGTEPLQTLPAQWWNWFLNRFTNHFNKVNVYVKNIFNELAQVLSIFNITPDGTEQTPTTSQLKTVFETCYPQYIKTVTTGTAVGCIPTVGTALGTTNNNILVTDSTGKLKPSGITVGTAAGCDASLFARKSEVDALYGNVAGCPLGTAAVGTATTFARSDHVHPMPTCVACAGNASTLSGYELCGAACPSTVAMRVDGGNLYAAHFNTLAGIENYTCFPGAAIAFIDADGWIRKTSGSNITAGNAYHANCAESALSACHLCLKNGSGVFYTDSNWVYAETGTQQPSFVWGTHDGVNNAIWNPSNFHVACADCACVATCGLAAYVEVSTCSFIGGGIAQIYYCANNKAMSLSNHWVALNGIKAGSAEQYEFTTLPNISKLNTADGKTLGLLCMDRQWHLIANCPDATGGTFTKTYYAQGAGIVA